MSPCILVRIANHYTIRDHQVSLGRKEGHTNVQISAEPGIELGTLWSEGRDLTNCANHARPKIS